LSLYFQNDVICPETADGYEILLSDLPQRPAPSRSERAFSFVSVIMPTVVIVHGTGVREPGYEEMVAVVARRLHLERPGYSIERCPWYKEHGVPPPPYQSLPLKATFRAAGRVSVPDELLAWQALYYDPLAELRDLSNTAAGSGNPTGAAMLAQEVRRVPLPESLKSFFIGTRWKEVRACILEDEITKKAIARGASRPDATRLAVARALVAELVRRGLERDEVLPDGEERDQWVDTLRQSMGTDLNIGTRGVPDMLKPAVRLVNSRLLRPFGESQSPIAGDIILYQARGKGIRGYLAKAISNAQPPVYVMAHSLGGVAAVDTLILEPTLNIEALITFGSQAPFFFEINALVSLEKGQPLPQHFPQLWLNVCDPNDLLSFRAEPAFSADPRIRDEQLDSGQPPIAAHGSYLGSNSFWKLVWSVIS
jgi:hypothetical protein